MTTESRAISVPRNVPPAFPDRAIAVAAGDRIVSTPVRDEFLGSGLRVLAAARPTAPIVEVRLQVPFASTDPLHPATAEVLAVGLLGGTPRHARADLDDSLAEVGASMRVSVRPEHLTVAASTLADGLPRLLALLAEVLRDASYPSGDLEPERHRLMQRVRMHRAQPHRAAREILLRRCFGDHPAAREVPAEPELTAVTRDGVRGLHERQLAPRGAGLALVGDLDPDRAVAIAADALDEWRNDLPATRLPSPPAVASGAIWLVDHPGARQVHVGLAAAAPAEDTPGHPAGYLANLVLGGYFASRLFENLRETGGYVYRCRSTIEQWAGTAAVFVEFATEPALVGQALAAARAELVGICDTRPPTDDEIETARGFAIGSRLVSLATPANLADALATLALRDRPVESLAGHTTLLATVPAAEVRAAAMELFAREALTGIVYGPTEAHATVRSSVGDWPVAQPTSEESSRT
jgi:predicted Zn-dependent peptidase